MTFQPWIPGLLPAGALQIASYRFNGAMTFQPWIPGLLPGALERLQIASMEP